MNQLDTFRFPFLGAREDGEPFEYLLLDIDPEKAHIAIFNWMVNHLYLDIQEKVELFIPSFLTLLYHFQDYTPGVVSSIKREKEEESRAAFYEITFNSETSLVIPAENTKELAQNFLSGTSLVDMLIKLIKDSLILKQGILVYLKHLSPYFSRIIDYSQEDYKYFKRLILDDLKDRIKANESSLQDIYNLLKDVKNPEDIPVAINLEYLRDNIESELSLDLFLMAFSQEESQAELIQLLKESKYQEKLRRKYAYLNYLISIKNLEKRLYTNYNQIVLIYLQAL